MRVKDALVQLFDILHEIEDAEFGLVFVDHCDEEVLLVGPTICGSPHLRMILQPLS